MKNRHLLVTAARGCLVLWRSVLKTYYQKNAPTQRLRWKQIALSAPTFRPSSTIAFHRTRLSISPQSVIDICHYRASRAVAPS